ncbi:hypothetical protein HIM_02209 [Hirsutella minnesotensis 3608]|nr:hypothetical protein HIM_02209 [Hirsutella minnesotensis 3608]
MSMQNLVESGRAAYAKGSHERALKQFTRVMQMCPCNRGGKRSRCSCKNYEAVAARDGSLFDEAMFTCHCDVGRMFNKCDHQLHISALDYRAATFEAMQQLDRAERDAQWILELAPRLPDGYLRLGKIARLKKNPWFAWKVYRGGVEANKSRPLESSRKLQQLHQALLPLQRRFLRKDPLTIFPLELIHHVFADFTVTELTRCIRVSKTWRGILESKDSQFLWRDLVFFGPLPHPPSKAALGALVARSGYKVRRIVIQSPDGLQLFQPKLSTLLSRARHLEHLELGPPHRLHYTFPRGPGLFQNLRHLKMNLCDYPDPSIYSTRRFEESTAEDLPDVFISTIAATLEHLDLIGMPLTWRTVDGMPNFPRLKLLRLLHDHTCRGQAQFQILHLAAKTPLLEQLSLESVLLDHPPLPIRNSCSSMWKNLKAFTFIFDRSVERYMATGGGSATLRSLTLINSLHNGRGFRYLDMDVCFDSEDLMHQHILPDADALNHFYGLTNEDGSQISQEGQLQNLELLRLESCYISPVKLKNILAAPMRGGNLHTFEMVFPQPSLDLPEGRALAQTLNQYDWLRGLESLRCLLFSGGELPSIMSDREANLLPDFLSSFPSLESVCFKFYLNPSSFCSVAAAIIRQQRIKVLYQFCLQGTALDMLRQLGEKHGVRVLFAEPPRLWPVPGL